MSYRTLLVHLDDTSSSDKRLKLAIECAHTYQAHLIGAAATGLSRFMFQENPALLSHPDLATHLTILRDRAHHVLNQFETTVQKSGITSFEKRIIDDEAGAGISLHTRYSDLVILGQTNPTEHSPAVTSDFPEYVILNAGRPTLIVPYAGTFAQIGQRILICWDGSREATRAITDAIPLLKQARIVHVAVFNATGSESHGSLPGADIGLYLARHGVNIETSQHTTNIDIGNALLSLASDLMSDLIVMGAYGHSRLRETLLGGTTQTILRTTPVPVFMSH